MPALLVAAALLAGGRAQAQKIRDHYVSRVEEDGTIYHTLPQTLFANPERGDLTFDITYKTRQPERHATINFTYRAAQPAEIDSVRFAAGKVVLAGAAGKLFIEPEKREWVHRYTLSVPVDPLFLFFDAAAEPVSVTLYAGGDAVEYRVKRAAWRSFAPVGSRIFEMIRYDDCR